MPAIQSEPSVEWLYSLHAELFADFLLKKSFRNTIRMSNGLDPDQNRRYGSKLYAKVFRRQVAASKERIMVCDCGISWPRGFKTFSMLNSAEHEIVGF